MRDIHFCLHFPGFMYIILRTTHITLGMYLFLRCLKYSWSFLERKQKCIFMMVLIFIVITIMWQIWQHLDQFHFKFLFFIWVISKILNYSLTLTNIWFNNYNDSFVKTIILLKDSKSACGHSLNTLCAYNFYVPRNFHELWIALLPR